MSMKPLYWVGAALRDLQAMPESVKDDFGYALFLAQRGEKSPKAKPLAGFGSAGVLEVVTHEAGGTFRAVYTVRFANAVYVLHCFQKKSKTGIATPKADMELIRARLRQAQAHAEAGE